MRRWRIKYLGNLRALCVPAFQRPKMNQEEKRKGSAKPLTFWDTQSVACIPDGEVGSHALPYFYLRVPTYGNVPPDEITKSEMNNQRGICHIDTQVSLYPDHLIWPMCTVRFPFPAQHRD